MKKILDKNDNKKFSRSHFSVGGFTLIEMLISITILSIITGMGILSLTGYKNRHSFQLDGTNILEGIRSAQNKAILGEQGTAWGIKFSTDTGSGSDYYEIFSGTTYATSSVVTTQTLSHASRFSNPPSGFSKTIIFTKTTGVPDVAQTIGVKTETGSDASVISVSKSATISQLPGKDMVGYWPFDEELGTNAYDASGKGNTGILQNSPAWQYASFGLCKAGGCLSFDGGSTSVSVSSPSSIPSGNSPYTISAWIKPVAYAVEGIVGWGNWGTTNAANALRLTTSGLTNYWGSNDLTVSVSGLTNGNWHQVVAEFDGTTRSMYVDAVLVGSDTPIGHNATVSNFKIGSINNGEYFNGLIDDVRVYNRALASSEVKTLYESY